MKIKLQITGSLIRPLMVGRPVCILEERCQRVTTNVQKVIEHKGNCVLFETQYTRPTDDMRELICQRREFVADGSLDILVAYTSEKFTHAMFPIYDNCELYGSLTIVGNKGNIPSEATVEKGRLLADIISAALGVGE